MDTRTILVQGGSLPCIPLDTAEGLARDGMHYFGTLAGIPCWCGSLNPDLMPLAQPFEPVNLRKFFNTADDTFRQAAAFARGVVDLHENAKFCGRCGTATRPVPKEHARRCPACSLQTYPRISPAVIMAVTRGSQILLARGVRFPNKKMFSVLAGFVSPAETLEDCVKREVFEETAIQVQQVTYVKSQPWPFPDSLMIGFTAVYASGDIRIDPKEIVEARWFDAHDLPLIPDAYTLAGQLIRSFVRSQK